MARKMAVAVLGLSFPRVGIIVLTSSGIRRVLRWCRRPQHRFIRRPCLGLQAPVRTRIRRVRVAGGACITSVNMTLVVVAGLRRVLPIELGSRPSKLRIRCR